MRDLLSRFIKPRTVWDTLLPMGVMVAFVFLTGPVGELDSYWHIKMGDWLRSSSATLHGDPTWTWGPYDPTWVTTQPLAEVVMSYLYQLFGWAGIVAIRVFGGAALLLVVVGASLKAVPDDLRKDIPTGRAMALLIACISLALPLTFQERPQAFSYLLYPIVGLWALTYLQSGTWPRGLVFFPLALLWPTIHSGGMVALVVFSAAAFARILVADGKIEEAKKAIATGWKYIAALALFPLATPAGWDYYISAYKIVTAGRDWIMEWARTMPLDLYVLPLWVLILLWLIASWKMSTITGERSYIAREAIFILTLLIFSFSAVRNVMPVLLVLAPLYLSRAAKAFTQSKVKQWESAENAEAYAKLVPLGVLVILFVFTLSSISNVSPLNNKQYPSRIYEGLNNTEGPRRVFNSYNLGGQMIGLTREDVKPAIDGRSDRYGKRIIDSYRKVLHLTPGWQKEWNKYSLATDIVLEKDDPFASWAQTEGWRLVCKDGKYLWLTKPGLSGECSDKFNKD